MYNEFEEKEYKSKFNIKIWNRIFKEMFKYAELKQISLLGKDNDENINNNNDAIVEM